MRVWMVALVLAGCAAPLDPGAPDETVPIHAPIDAYQLLGPETTGAPDARVFVGVCGSANNLYAYNINVSAWPVQDQLPLQAVSAPNATSFAIVAFLPGPDGLVEAARWTGGTDTVDPHHEDYTPRPNPMPEHLMVPVDEGGVARLVIGCTGAGAVNYVWGDPEGKRPDYLDAVVASGVDAFLAIGTDGLFAHTIYLPPQTVSVGTVWSTIGNVRVAHDRPLPQLEDALRVQTDTIEWSGGAGWTTVECSHRGWSDHGHWVYDGDLHGDVRLHEGTMADEIGLLWLSQELLFGAMEVHHTADGTADARIRFEVQHAASASVGWTTMCQGVHLGAPLQDLFGAPGARAWERMSGLLE